MKRIIYTLTAVFSAASAVLLIADYITYISESGKFSFILYRDPLIAVLLGLCVLSVVQLKKHTPGIILVFCGYVFISSSEGFGYGLIGCDYFGTLLLMAAALTPAVYELWRYGMAARQEPKAPGQGRWRWLVTAAIVVTAYRVLPFIMETVIGNYDSLDNFLGNRTADIMGICALICFVIFCGLMNRRTSALYRMFFTGCILFDAVQTVFPSYGFLSHNFPPEKTGVIFVLFYVIYVLFILLILLHAFLTRRDGLLPQEIADSAQQSETPAA